MSITTKTGDSGQTSLWGGKRVSKSCQEVEAIGEIDELNSYLGLIAGKTNDNLLLKNQLDFIQRGCFIVGSELASVQALINNSKIQLPKIKEKDTKQLEAWIKLLEKSLPPLQNFILPGGSELASHLFIARAIARRAERTVVRLKKPKLAEVQKFLNRLSDLLFLLARAENFKHNQKETIWKS